uniref:Retrotransposon gag domain-containing protein n=1 Tax=Pygocentrus nattereri TaxID=42514 RepID=A0AAR2L2Q9_PYGNA
MAVLTGSFGPFDESVETWEAYTERFDFFVAANSIKDEVKVVTFLSVMGAKVFSLLRSLVQPEKPGNMSYTDVVKVLDSRYSPKPLQIAERFRFHKQNQEEGETIAQYVAVLKRLTEHCDFKDNLDDALHDQLVCGLRSEVIQKRFLTEADLTLKKAIEIALSMELVAKAAQQLGVSARVVCPTGTKRQMCLYCPIKAEGNYGCPCSRECQPAQVIPWSSELLWPIHTPVGYLTETNA